MKYTDRQLEIAREIGQLLVDPELIRAADARSPILESRILRAIEARREQCGIHSPAWDLVQAFYAEGDGSTEPADRSMITETIEITPSPRTLDLPWRVFAGAYGSGYLLCGECASTIEEWADSSAQPGSVARTAGDEGEGFRERALDDYAREVGVSLDRDAECSHCGARGDTNGTLKGAPCASTKGRKHK